MAEQCNRHRREGGQCLSEASLPAAGVGEPRRAPGGPCHGQNGFGYFCRNKSGSSRGAKPGIKSKKQVPAIFAVQNLSHKNPQRTVNHSEQAGRCEGVGEYVGKQNLTPCPRGTVGRWVRRSSLKNPYSCLTPNHDHESWRSHLAHCPQQFLQT